MYPCWKYHPKKAPVLLNSEEEHDELGDGWFSSPAEFGVETCPGATPDKNIAANKGKKFTPKAPEKTQEESK